MIKQKLASNLVNIVIMYPFCYCKLTKMIFTGVLLLMTVASET